MCSSDLRVVRVVWVVRVFWVVKVVRVFKVFKVVRFVKVFWVVRFVKVFKVVRFVKVFKVVRFVKVFWVVRVVKVVKVFWLPDFVFFSFFWPATISFRYLWYEVFLSLYYGKYNKVVLCCLDCKSIVT